jgi:hypothetical protein
MRRLPLGILFFLLIGHAFADDIPKDLLDLFKDRALAIGIVARVVGGDDQDAWNTNSLKVTIPGRPVSIRIMSSNVIVIGKFTPYEEGENSLMLVAQGQIWVSGEDSQFQYYTTVKTLPVKFGEKIFFFPLGVDSQKTAPQIEVEITIVPYAQADQLAQPEKTPDASGGKGDTKGAKPEVASPVVPSVPLVGGEVKSPKQDTTQDSPSAAQKKSGQ